MDDWLINNECLQFYIIQMNPFERLRQTIDKVNIVYQYNDDQYEQPQRDTQPSRPQKPSQQHTIQTVSNPAQIQRVKQTYDKAQTNHLVEISQLTSKVQQLTKNLKRVEATVQSQMNDIVSLEKENDLLKENLNEQYRNIVASDEKERKLKQEIYRINVTVNELAIQINSQRNAKKQLIKENERLKSQLINKEQEIKNITIKLEGQKQKVRAQLQERIEMFEYNVKKNAQDRKDYKDSLAKAQQNYQVTTNKYLQMIDEVKQNYYSAQKQAQIANIKRKNMEETVQRVTKQLQQLKQAHLALTQEFKLTTSRLEQNKRLKDQLQQQNSSLGSELQEQRRNIKVKVVQVRDQTALLELQMYKRQCRQLMQQKAILNSIGRSQRTMDPSYKLITSQISGK